MPTRDLTNVYTTMILGEWNRFPAGSVLPIKSSSKYILSGSSSGTSNPDWKNQVSKGIDATRNYVRTEHQQHPAVGRHTFYTPIAKTPLTYNKGEFRFAHYQNVNASIGSSDTALRDLALTRIKRKLASEAGAVNDLVPLVELREMRGLVRSLATLATKGMSDWFALLHRLHLTGRTRDLGYLKRSGYHGKKALSSVQDAWLTFSFGLSPTVSAVSDASKHIVNYIERVDKCISVHGGARKVWNDSAWAVEEIPSGVAGLSAGGTRVQMFKQLDYLYRGAFDLKLKSSNDYGVLASFGLIPEKLPSVGWELLPYSWVFDYFTNISQFLDDTFIVPPGSTRFLYLNRRFTCEYSWMPRWSNLAGSTVSTTGSPAIGKYYQFERASLSALPHIGLRVKSVDEISNHAVSKVLNLASLLRFKTLHK